MNVDDNRLCFKSQNKSESTEQTNSLRKKGNTPGLPQDFPPQEFRHPKFQLLNERNITNVTSTDKKND